VTAADPTARATTGQPRRRSVGFLLAALGHDTIRTLRDELAPTGLEPRAYAVLRALAGSGGTTQGAVATALSIPPSRMVAVVDDLEQRRLVERRAVALDRRARELHLTRAGTEALAAARERAERHEEALLATLTPAERADLLRLLARLADARGIGSREPAADPGRPEGA
jgi:DNA-binding MarR family transcriptional regulator